MLKAPPTALPPGSREPIDVNKTALGRAHSRRTEFTVLVQ